MSFNKKTWLPDGDLTEKEMNDLEDRTQKAFGEFNEKFTSELIKNAFVRKENSKGVWFEHPSGLVIQIIYKSLVPNWNAWASMYRAGERIDLPKQMNGSLYAVSHSFESNASGWISIQDNTPDYFWFYHYRPAAVTQLNHFYIRFVVIGYI